MQSYTLRQVITTDIGIRNELSSLESLPHVTVSNKICVTFRSHYMHHMVCVLDTQVSLAKMAETIEISFGDRLVCPGTMC